MSNISLGGAAWNARHARTEWNGRKVETDFLVTLTTAGGVYVQPVKRMMNIVRLEGRFTTVDEVEAEMRDQGYVSLKRLR